MPYKEQPTEEFLSVQRSTILSGNYLFEAAQENLEALQDSGLEVTPENISKLLSEKRKTRPDDFLGSYAEKEARRGEARRDKLEHFTRMYTACLKERSKKSQVGRATAKAMSGKHAGSGSSK